MRLRVTIYSIVIAILVIASAMLVTPVSAESATKEYVKEIHIENMTFYAGYGSVGEGILAITSGLLFAGDFGLALPSWDPLANPDAVVHRGILLANTSVGDFKCYNITDISLPVSGTVTIVTSSAVVAYGGIIVAGVMEIDSDGDLYDYIFVFKMDYDGNVLWAKAINSTAGDLVSGTPEVKVVQLPNGRVGLVWYSYYYRTLCFAVLDAYNGSQVYAKAYGITNDVEYVYAVDAYENKVAVLTALHYTDPPLTSPLVLWIIDASDGTVDKLITLDPISDEEIPLRGFVGIDSNRILVIISGTDSIAVLYMDYDGNVLWAKSYRSVSSYIVAGGGGAYAASIFTGSDVIFNPAVGTILDNGSLLFAGTFGEIVPISGVNYMKYLYPAVVIYDSSGNPVFMKYYQFVGCRDIPLTEMNFDISPVMVAAGDDGITVVTKALEILPVEIDTFTRVLVTGHTVVAKVNMTYGEDVDPETLERIQCVNIAGNVSLADVTGNVTYYDILQEGINNDTIVMYSSNVELSPLDLEVKTTYEKAAEEEEEEVTSELVLPWWLTVLLVAVVVIAVLAIVNVAKHTIEDVRYSRMRFVRRK